MVWALWDIGFRVQGLVDSGIEGLQSSGFKDLGFQGLGLRV